MEQADLQTKLAEYEANLAEVEAALASDPSNAELTQLRSNLKEYIDLTRDLLGVQTKPAAFAPPPSIPKATGGLYKAVEVGQYVQGAPGGKPTIGVVMDAPPPPPGMEPMCTVSYLGNLGSETVLVASLQAPKFPKESDILVGGKAEAIYSADGNWYPCTVNSVVGDGEYQVTYDVYNNTENVSIKHMRVQAKAGAGGDGGAAAAAKRKKAEEETEGPLGEFVLPEKLKILPTDSEEVRAAKKKKVHSLKSAHRLKKSVNEKAEKAASWNSFNQKAGKSKTKGFMSGMKKGSIFSTSDNGRVGVTGSGKGTTGWKGIDVHKVRKATTDNDDDDDD